MNSRGYFLKERVRDILRDKIVERSLKKGVDQHTVVEKEERTVAETSSSRAVLMGPGALSVRMVLKVAKASRAASACFLKADSDGMSAVAVLAAIELIGDEVYWVLQ